MRIVAANASTLSLVCFQVREEATLQNQLKINEAKRKEREKRAQELQRLINASERSSMSPEGYRRE